MSHYKLRVTWSKTDCTYEMFEQLLKTNCTVYASVDEGDGERTEFHSHYYIITKVKESKLRILFRGILGTSGSKGNAVYSLSEMDVEDDYCIEYLAYMLKEGILINSGFPSEVIERAKEHCDAVKKEIKAKKLQKRSVISVLTELCKERWSIEKDGFKVDPNGFILCIDSLVPFIVNYYKEQGNLFRQFAVIDLCRTILLQLCPQYQDQLIVSMIENLKK